jgi:hypothetical protein
MAGYRLFFQALLLAAYLSVVTAQGSHAEWCAGAGASNTDDGARCPEFVSADGTCPAGCEVDAHAIPGDNAGVVAVCGMVLVVMAFVGGVIVPLTHVEAETPKVRACSLAPPGQVRSLCHVQNEGDARVGRHARAISPPRRRTATSYRCWLPPFLNQPLTRSLPPAVHTMLTSTAARCCLCDVNRSTADLFLYVSAAAVARRRRERGGVKAHHTHKMHRQIGVNKRGRLSKRD